MTTVVLCILCKAEKPTSEFYKDYRYSSGVNPRCKPCERNRQRWSHLLRLYGITKEQYDEMLARQDGACAICLRAQEKPLDVDHCHESGVVRGLLCRVCNVMLGHAEDDPAVLRRAIDYLGRFTLP